MDIQEETIRDRCTEAVFERGQNYRSDGRIQRLERYGGVVTAAVQGSTVYDVTVDVESEDIDSDCTCPYQGPGDCKHVVAVLLKAADDPPPDESDRVDALLDDVTETDLRAFLSDALAREPELRERFLAQFDDTQRPSVDEYRAEISRLFDDHTDDYPVVVEAIDFSRFFDIATQYRDRDRYRAAATVYRALFEAIDDNIHLVDAAYDHYAKSLRFALDGYVECVAAADLDTDEFESWAGVLDERATTGADVHREQFRTALAELDDTR